MGSAPATLEQEHHMTPRSLLTAADAARILGLTPATVRLMARRGELAVDTRTVGGIQLFTRDEVDRVAAARKTRALGTD